MWLVFCQINIEFYIKQAFSNTCCADRVDLTMRKVFAWMFAESHKIDSRLHFRHFRLWYYSKCVISQPCPCTLPTNDIGYMWSRIIRIIAKPTPIPPKALRIICHIGYNAGVPIYITVSNRTITQATIAHS